jgi:hypothetical protein
VWPSAPTARPALLPPQLDVRQEADEGLSEVAISAIFLAVMAILLPILVVLEKVCRAPK